MMLLISCICWGLTNIQDAGNHIAHAQLQKIKKVYSTVAVRIIIAYTYDIDNEMSW